MISSLHFTVLTSQSSLCVNIAQEAKNKILIHFISAEFNSTILHRLTLKKVQKQKQISRHSSNHSSTYSVDNKEKVRKLKCMFTMSAGLSMLELSVHFQYPLF